MENNAVTIISDGPKCAFIQKLPIMLHTQKLYLAYIWTDRIPGPNLDFWNKATFFFISIPKTGSLSIERSLPIEYQLKFYFGHMYGKYYPKRIMGKLKTIVRNPFDRLVSAYFFMIRGGFRNNREYLIIRDSYEDFEDWVLNGLSVNDTHHSKARPAMEPTILQTEWLLNEYGNWILPKENIGRFENLEADALRLFGIQKLLHINKSDARKPWQEYYTNQKVRDKVYRLYKRDFRLLGYTNFSQE